MIILFNVLELVCISLGAGAAFIFDCFFFLSHKKHKVVPFEYKALQRINLMSTVACGIAILAFALEVALAIENPANIMGNSILDVSLNISLAKIILLIIALLAGLTMRRIHLPALRRHQNDHAHLSDSMIEHNKSLVSTSVYSTISWVYIIILTAIQPTNNILSGLNNENAFIIIAVSYIIICYALEHAIFHLKNKYFSL